mmetsp:Transcript_3574/g.4090  ORF Transcript_3574/g.4090 Transcript_3574/m.4090 type:complete len:209 (-) Transcript_3574:1065-1691(-)
MPLGCSGPFSLLLCGLKTLPRLITQLGGLLKLPTQCRVVFLHVTYPCHRELHGLCFGLEVKELLLQLLCLLFPTLPCLFDHLVCLELKVYYPLVSRFVHLRCFLPLSGRRRFLSFAVLESLVEALLYLCVGVSLSVLQGRLRQRFLEAFNLITSLFQLITSAVREGKSFSGSFVQRSLFAILVDRSVVFDSLRQRFMGVRCSLSRRRV